LMAMSAAIDGQRLCETPGTVSVVKIAENKCDATTCLRAFARGTAVHALHLPMLAPTWA